MKTKEFDYPLPKDLIAQYPVEPRDRARMMVLIRKKGEIIHSQFSQLPSFLEPGDLLVANDTKVIPARLWGRKPTGGRVEVLLLREREEGVWECLTKGKGVREGIMLTFSQRLKGEIVAPLQDGKRLIRLQAQGDLMEAIQEVGNTPLPPYIRGGRGEEVDREAYQTIFAKKEGAVAAPTAGLHFTAALLEALKEKGVRVAFITLHTGWASFRPLRTEEVEEHRLDEEYFEVSPEAAQLLNETRREGRRIVAVGTTTTWALESAISPQGEFSPIKGWTSLYIYPGYRFRAVDALITNFHLPRSSLFLLVCAFASRGLTMRAYQEAIRERYRFYSYGDGMLIL